MLASPCICDVVIFGQLLPRLILGTLYVIPLAFVEWLFLFIAFLLLASMNQFFSDSLSEKTKYRMAAGVKARRWLWVAPLGHLNKQKSFIVDPEMGRLPEIAARTWETRKDQIAQDAKLLSRRLEDQKALNLKAIKAKLNAEISAEDTTSLSRALMRRSSALKKPLPRSMLKNQLTLKSCRRLKRKHLISCRPGKSATSIASGRFNLPFFLMVFRAIAKTITLNRLTVSLMQHMRSGWSR